MIALADQINTRSDRPVAGGGGRQRLDIIAGEMNETFKLCDEAINYAQLSHAHLKVILFNVIVQSWF
ncbi:hypothetical protein [Sphingomonas japonica]|uniref:Uncharacterized protein n=1 Tax=Sphingomonas japonica TaxID=511662 RepID=A0ABX0TZ66_9SPHN|nr:hypothetical protein [Sphingomonas japonica]NIJ22462.1 hypothetical protein [Sphingomonas japonica]